LKPTNQRLIHSLAAVIVMASWTAMEAAPIVYMTNVANPTAFGTADLGADTYASINTGLTQQLDGLGSINGALYGAGRNSSTLYQIDPTTGGLTSVGSASFTYADFGSTLAGLYGLDASGNLYSVSSTTGASTLLGSTGLSTSSGNFSLSNGSGTLYFAGNNGDLYTLNTANGAASLVGFMGNGVFLGRSVPLEMSALDFAGGTLYADEAFPGSNVVFTVNTSTGAAAAVTFISGAPESADGWTQIVTATSGVPEPGTSLLVLIGLGCAPLLRKGFRA
jgi:hypothetical protein